MPLIYLEIGVEFGLGYTKYKIVDIFFIPKLTFVWFVLLNMVDIWLEHHSVNSVLNEFYLLIKLV